MCCLHLWSRQNILLIPEDVVLPEDSVHANVERDICDGKELTSANETFDNLCEKVRNAKLTRAILRDKLKNLKVTQVTGQKFTSSSIYHCRKCVTDKWNWCDVLESWRKWANCPTIWNERLQNSRSNQPTSIRSLRRSRTTLLEKRFPHNSTFK